MSEALKMVKAEMGLDAMILSSKQERRRGILGFFSKPYFEVTAALEQKKVQRPVHYQEKPERELSTREEFQNSMLAPLARELRELRERVEVLAKKDAEKKDAEKKEALPPTAAEKSEDEIKPFQPQKEGNAPRIFAREDMEEIKKLLLNAVAAKEEKGRSRYRSRWSVPRIRCVSKIWLTTANYLMKRWSFWPMSCARKRSVPTVFMPCLS
ncbi:hypothetical protein [Geotalea toluenoxydans]|uniref:hypothetical protein n=1 Tax=Geotalea toluenoxydans TaxID=421624 RepID=UPI0034E28A2B